MRVAVVGSRDFPCLEAVEAFVQSLPPDTMVVSGGARGVDRTAEHAARNSGLLVLSIPAQWKERGRAAGYERNERLVDEVDVVVAFWDGQSPGTKHTMSIATLKGKQLHVMTPEDIDACLQQARPVPAKDPA